MATAAAAPTSPAAASAIASALNAATNTTSQPNKPSPSHNRPRVAPLRTKCLPSYPSELRSPLIYGGGNTPRSSGVYSAGPHSAFFPRGGFDSLYLSSTASTPLSASLKRPRGYDSTSPGDTDGTLDPTKTPITPPAAYMDFLRTVTPTASPSYTPIGATFPIIAKAPGFSNPSSQIATQVITHPAVPGPSNYKSRECKQPSVQDDNEDDDDEDDEEDDEHSDKDDGSDSGKDGEDDGDDDSISDDSSFLSDFTDDSSAETDDGEEGTSFRAVGKSEPTDQDVNMADVHQPRTRCQTSQGTVVGPEPNGPSSSHQPGGSDTFSRPSKPNRRGSNKERKMEIQVPPSSDFIWAFPQSATRATKPPSPRTSSHHRSQSTPAVPSPRTASTVRANGTPSIASPAFPSAKHQPSNKHQAGLRISTAVASAAAAATAAAAGLTPPPGMNGRMTHPILSPLPSASFPRSPLVSPLNAATPLGLAARSIVPPCNTPATATHGHPPGPSSNCSLPTSPTNLNGPTRTLCQVIQRTITYSSRHNAITSPTTPSHPSSLITEVSQHASDAQTQDESDRGASSMKRRKYKE